MASDSVLRPVDPDILVVALANGLEAWIRHHHRPQGTVMLWLHLGCGSLSEEEHERGAAHFLEHLFFRGTERFPPARRRSSSPSWGPGLACTTTRSPGSTGPVFR